MNRISLGWTLLLGIFVLGMVMALAIAPRGASSGPTPAPTRTPRIGIEATP